MNRSKKIIFAVHCLLNQNARAKTVAKCPGAVKEFLGFYQKDGPGMLKRMYLDRIYKSKNYSDLSDKSFKLLPQLICKKCGRLLGVPMVYEKEKRFAFRLFQGAVVKKIVKSDHI